jgi:hypothetical protein
LPYLDRVNADDAAKLALGRGVFRSVADPEQAIKAYI